MLYEHFSRDPESLDESGYVDPNRIGPEKLRTFIQSKAHQELMRLYKSVNALAKGQYAEEFQTTLETAGRVLIFNNKNFHAAEQWKNRHTDREIYVIRMFPLYDVKIRLKRTLHGVPINNYLLDMKTGEVRRFSEEVDVRRIPAEDKVTL
jgi:ectoine hydroxylase-related dioxygenase (phytanoyl-CoA dioxygenase family)